jgi:hypothetical protein
MKTKYVISGLKFDKDLENHYSLGLYAIQFEGEDAWHRTCNAMLTAKSDRWYFHVEGYENGSFKMVEYGDLVVGAKLIYDI